MSSQPINFERKYYLSKHLYATTERSYSKSTEKRIFSETSGRCPKCKKPLNWVDYQGNQSSRDNQIAHIYSRKEFEKFELSLDQPYHINSLDEIDSYHNLVVLCGKCHPEYDNNTTYEDYALFLELKKQLWHNADINELIYELFDDTLNAIKDNYLDSIYSNSPNNYNYDKIYLQTKLDYNNITVPHQVEIKTDITNYFLTIQECIEEYERNYGSVGSILNEFRNIYNKLKLKHSDKNKVIRILKNSIIQSIDESLDITAMILISYMIMKCEVLDNAPE